MSDGKGLCGVWQLRSKWSQSCGVLAAAVVGSMFRASSIAAVVMKRACSGGALAFFPNIHSQKDGEDLLEDPHEVVTSWTH